MLEGKRLVVIGGSSGIGLSACKAFVRAGARLVIVGKDEASCAAAASALGEAAQVQVADARDPQTAVRAIATCQQQWGGFEGLYHVAGGSGRRFGDGPLHELSLEGWHYTLELNLTSLMLSNQAALRAWLAQGTAGSILNLGSVLADSPSPHFFSTHAYAAAKSAIVGFSRSIAAYYAKHNLRVNVLAPGLVNTPMAQRAAQDESIMQFIQSKQPLDHGRIAQPQDLDGLACYFFSDYARFTTGQVIAVDGGWSLSEGQIS